MHLNSISSTKWSIHVTYLRDVYFLHDLMLMLVDDWWEYLTIKTGDLGWITCLISQLLRV